MRCTLSSRLLLKHLDRELMHFILAVLLLYPDAYRPGEACAAAAESGGTSPEALLLCRACGHELAGGTDIHFVPSRLALSSRNHTVVGGRRVNIQMFENPHGHQFEVITFRKADVTLHWPAEKHFSWFPGSSWTVATCPRLGFPAEQLARHNHKDQIRGGGGNLLSSNHSPSTE
ncbi:uncharacterized protein si:ch211-51h9.7 isoform X2 [Xyrichtys novacula]|uniref:Uncharacterized protein si:ch211-51h9.7 isoform X2 n=1 Tax=Xyrichtys novacula TaxID=13765 RepID=A0AAV1G6R3_XYRNO|nr:uncharacterized protein si:ch211-51h9.7 isoform X2 [Xyrichtys novacula]